MLSIIDMEDQIAKLIPHLDEVIEEGLIAISRVEVVRCLHGSGSAPAKA